MSIKEGLDYDDDRNYRSFIEQQDPPWREGWTADRPEVIPSTLNTDEQQKAVEASLGMIQPQVGILTSRGIRLDPDEAYQNGALGLIDASTRFDPTIGVKFSTFAKARVRGAVIDGERSFDKLTGKDRNEATVVSMLNGTRAISIFSSAYVLAHGDGVMLIDTIPDDQPSVEEVVETDAAVLSVHEAIGTLDPRQQDILLQKMRGLGHEAIAANLGISISTITNDLSKAYAILRDLLPPSLFD